MKILVSGAGGFVGSHLVPLLLEQGHAVTALGRDPARVAARPWGARVAFVACDIRQPLDGNAAALAALAGHDAAVHLAWQGLPNYQALFHFEDNLPADYRFLKALLGLGVRQLLVAGTCFEYGMQEGRLHEGLPAAPANPYALAKDSLRRQLQALQAAQPYTLQWARLFYMHGPGQAPNSLLAQLDRAIDAGAAHFDMSGGEQLRDYLPVQEVARKLALLLAHPACGGVVNVCSGAPVSVRRLAEQHVARRGAAIRLNLGHYPYPAHEPMAFWGDPGRLAQLEALERT